MFITIKAKVIAIIAAVIVLTGAIIGSIAYVAKASAVPFNGKTVVIDAGHGGIDGGVVGSETGIKESDINLAVAKALDYFLSKAGYKTVLTRKNSDGLYSASDRNKKRSDLNKRKQIIEKAKPDLVVSIHQNFFPLKSVSGAQVFYAPTSDIGQEIAVAIQNGLNLALQCNRSAMKGDYYILQCSQYPSILIECGFLSNPSDEALLVSSAYQEKLAYSIFCGIDLILGPFAQDNPGDIFG